MKAPFLTLKDTVQRYKKTFKGNTFLILLPPFYFESNPGVFSGTLTLGVQGACPVMVGTRKHPVSYVTPVQVHVLGTRSLRNPGAFPRSSGLCPGTVPYLRPS